MHDDMITAFGIAFHSTFIQLISALAISGPAAIWRLLARIAGQSSAGEGTDRKVPQK